MEKPTSSRIIRNKLLVLLAAAVVLGLAAKFIDDSAMLVFGFSYLGQALLNLILAFTRLGRGPEDVGALFPKRAPGADNWVWLLHGHFYRCGQPRQYALRPARKKPFSNFCVYGLVKTVFRRILGINLLALIGLAAVLRLLNRGNEGGIAFAVEFAALMVFMLLTNLGSGAFSESVPER